MDIAITAVTLEQHLQDHYPIRDQRIWAAFIDSNNDCHFKSDIGSHHSPVCEDDQYLGSGPGPSRYADLYDGRHHHDGSVQERPDILRSPGLLQCWIQWDFVPHHHICG